jgi:hypothetical protein
MHGAVEVMDGQASQLAVVPHSMISGQSVCGKSTHTLHGSHVMVLELTVEVLVPVPVVVLVDCVEVWTFVQ